MCELSYKTKLVHFTCGINFIDLILDVLGIPCRDQLMHSF